MESTNISLIMKLWQTLDSLQKQGKQTIYDLLDRVPELEQILSMIASEKTDTFDIEVRICDEEEKRDLFTIPSAHKTVPSIKADYAKLSIEAFVQIVLYGRKVSEWLIDSCLFEIDREKVATFLQVGLDDSWSILKQRIGYKRTPWAEIGNHKETLEKENIVWCYNMSCTGKTWLAVQLLDNFQGVKIAYNTSSSQLVDRDFLCFLLEYGYDCCFLIDDLQGDSDFATQIVKYICSHKGSLKNRNVFVVLVSWNGLVEDNNIKTLLNTNRIYRFKTTPDKNLFLLKTRVKKISPHLLNVCGDNLCLLSRASMLSSKTSTKKSSKQTKGISVYSSAEYKKLLFEEFVPVNNELQIKLAYICAVLGSYEYETPLSFLEQYGIIEPSTIKEAKFANGTIYVGHKDVCGFIAKYIEEIYEVDISQQEIIMEYIKSIDGTLKWKALLHIGHNKKSEVYYFGFIWNLLNDLMDALRKAAKTDPTFSKTPSSMCFILLVANYFREVDDFRDVADAFANCFSIVDGHVAIDFECCRTTQDFGKIKEFMIAEDSLSDPDKLGYVSGSQLDEFMMHSNWLLSLLVQVGSIMRRFGYVDLVTYAEQDLINNQSSDGSWYPNRVPWITACALRGLSKVEYRTETGKYVKKYTKNDEPIKIAISYLLENMNPSGYWDAHTGGWNEICETSAMVLDALHKFGIKCSELPSTKIALDYLNSHVSYWMIPGKEIDGASTACCLMDALGVEETLLNYIKQLTERNISGLFSIPTQEELRDQSCKAALIAYYVTELCWNIIERDIDQLMEEFLNDAIEESSSSIDLSDLLNKEGTKMEVKVYGGNNQFNEGNGTMVVESPQSFQSIEDEFAVLCTSHQITDEAKAIILPVLQELDSEAKNNTEKIKNDGSSSWVDKLKGAFDGVANIASIASAPWWAPLTAMITAFIARL